ncbi:MAG TPA: oligosaccharide flippase family protein [Terracidiphilus sp.]|jgi:O-antigen/teichoic acid export membrane protein
MRRSIAWNYAGYFFKILVNLALTSYLARRVAPAEYGLFLFVMAMSATLYLLDLGISYFLVQSYVEALAKASSEKLGNLLWTVFVALAGLGALGLMLMFGLALALPGPFNIPPSQIHEAVIIFVVAGMIMQVALPSIALEQLYQAANRFDTLNAVQMTGVVATFVLSVLAIHYGFGIVGLAAVQLVAVVLQLILLVVRLPALIRRTGLGRVTHPHLEWSMLSELLHKSKWAVVHNLSLYGADLLTWVIITSCTSMKDAALFGIASKLPRQLWNIVDRGANILLPIYSKSAMEQDHQALCKAMFVALKLLVGVLLPFVVLGCLFARPILQLWAGDSYADAAATMQWLLIASFAHGVGYPSDELLYVLGKAGKSAQISIWTGTLGSVAALLLVSHFGVAGVAAGIAIVRIGTNCWWFTRESIRMTKSSMWSLVRFVSEGLAVPVVVLVLAGVLLLRVADRMPLVWIVVSAVIIGASTLGIWAYRTALPYLKAQPGLSA